MTGSVEVMTECGSVRGTRNAEGVLFHGIPYAAPPVGDLRFRAPAPVQPWSGTRDATQVAPGSVQPWRTEDPWNNYFNPPTQSFDCLTVRVHAPADAVAAPVIAWIHGGGFIAGVGTAPASRGDTWVRDGIVHVAINYRVGIDGFVLLPGAVETGDDNLGLRDQIAALKWIQRNIAAFGGDPENVTVMGQSGGAVCVAMLMASPRAKGLFRRAIAQSGAPQGSFSVETALAKAQTVAELAGLDLGADALRTMDEDETRRVAQAADELAASQLSLDAAQLPIPFTAVHGTSIVPEPVLEALRAGASSDVQLLVGSTRDEVAGMMAKLGLTDPANEALIPLVKDVLAVSDETIAAYRESRHTDSDLVALCGAVSDALFVGPSIEMAARHQGESFLYEFDWQSPSLPEGMGADHTFDIPFVQDDFESLRSTTSVADEVLGDGPLQALATQMHGAFVRFVTSGDPGWSTYDSTRATVQVFGSVPAQAGGAS